MILHCYYRCGAEFTAEQTTATDWMVCGYNMSYKASSSDVCSSMCPVAHQEINASSARGNFVTSSYAWVYYYVYLPISSLAWRQKLLCNRCSWLGSSSRLHVYNYIIIFTDGNDFFSYFFKTSKYIKVK